MKLYLQRHGLALPKQIDPDQALSDEGRQGIMRLAEFLKQRAQATRVYHSGKRRAQQTAEIVASVMAPGKSIERLPGIEPMDLPISIAKQIEQWNDDTLVVGHLPFMARLVSLLVSGGEDAYAVTFQQPGTIVCLQGDVNIGWSIDWVLTPELVG
jgi:phosphohistidine phosphatase